MTLTDWKQYLLHILVISSQNYIVIFFLYLVFEGKPDYFKPLYLGLGVAIATHKYLYKEKK